MTQQQYDDLLQEIAKLKQRNARVEADKAWETSISRKFMVACLTYAVIVIFFHSAGFTQPFINALVPTLGFLLSTITGNLIKKRWIDTMYKK